MNGKTKSPARPSFAKRLAIVLGLAWPLTAQATLEDASHSVANDAGQLVRRAETANSAFIRGDMYRWRDLISPISDDFTLMQPFGGAPSHGFDASNAHLDQLARTFRRGEGVVEMVESYASNDIVVLVMIERQHGEVGGLPDQDWSLRVTQVYRRHGEVWELVHRHADPLVRNIGLERTAALARGAP